MSSVQTSAQIDHAALVTASGDGYNGKYRFLRTPSGWCLIGPGGDYLTPGIGVPMYAETPEALVETIRKRRPRIKIVATSR